jgi:ribosome biogenesis GTPase
VLETIGYDAATAASFAPWDAADASAGRVVRVDRGVLTVLTESGPVRVTVGGTLLARIAKDPGETPCVGDWVVVRSWPDNRDTVEHVLPRRSVVRTQAGDPLPLAANLDVVAVVADPTAPAPTVGPLLERAATSGARPILVLVGDATGQTVHAGDDIEVVRVDLAGGPGLERLRDLIGGRRTMALLAAPGADTAALARALVGASVIGARHTRHGLTLLPGGGVVLDLRLPPAPSIDGRTSNEGAP